MILGDILVVLVSVFGCVFVIRSLQKAAATRRRLDLLRELSRRESLSGRSSDAPFV